MQDQSNGTFQVNKITDGVSIALDHFKCSHTERAFLDDIRENGEYVVIGKREYIQMKWGKPTAIYQEDFTKCNLKELIEGKG